MNKQNLADYLHSIVKPLTPNGEPHVDLKTDDMGLLLTLTVPDTDFGKVIGRGGETIKAIRTVVAAVGMTSKMRVSIKVNDPEADKISTLGTSDAELIG